jgi:hypothetical protein
VLALGDLNGDGLLDAVLAYPTGGNFWVFWGDRASAFRPASSRDLPRSLRDVSAAAVADFTHDGRPDIVCTNLQGNVYVFVNNGTEQVDRWAMRETFVGGSLQSLAISDLNRDGKTDLVVSSIGASRRAAWRWAQEAFALRSACPLALFRGFTGMDRDR